MKKNSVQLLFILCVFLVSFNIFAKSTSFKADSILFTKTIPFEKLPKINNALSQLTERFIRIPLLIT